MKCCASMESRCLRHLLHRLFPVRPRHNQCSAPEARARASRQTVRMKTNTLLTLSVVAVGTFFAASAQAGWSVGLNIGGPGYYPAPVMVAAPPVCAPTVMVYPPRVVCPPPRPVCPPVVYVPPCHTWGRYDSDRYDRNFWHRGDRDDWRNDRHGNSRGHDQRGHDRDDRDHRGAGRR